MPFHLFSRDDGSLCISPVLPDFVTPIRTVIAPSWLAAKRALGFDLSLIQIHLLDS